MSEVSIGKDKIESAISYEDYLELIEDLLKEGKTTGEDQSLAKTEYADLNLRRMRRIEKTFRSAGELASVMKSQDEGVIFLVLTEGWCGDAAQILPIFHILSEEIGQIDLKLLLRDEHLDLMDQFLTNGSRSIPKLIVLKTETLEVLGSWGPRPADAQDLLKVYKANPEMSKDEFSKQLQLWYAKDKGRSIEKELAELMQKCLAEQ